MCPQHFVARRNIDNFHSRLLFEEDAGVRDVLLRLLIAEEDKYGSREEQISIVREKIMRNAFLLNIQQKIIGKMRKNGIDHTEANRLLVNLVEVQKLLYSRLEIIGG